jgi:hypothetical protein
MCGSEGSSGTSTLMLRISRTSPTARWNAETAWF